MGQLVRRRIQTYIILWLPMSFTDYGIKAMKKLAIVILSVVAASFSLPALSKVKHSATAVVSFTKPQISKTINIAVKKKKTTHPRALNKEQIKPANPCNGYLFKDDNYISDPNDPRSPKWNKIDDHNCGDYE
jgi:hypothetical protein